MGDIDKLEPSVTSDAAAGDQKEGHHRKPMLPDEDTPAVPEKRKRNPRADVDDVKYDPPKRRPLFFFEAHRLMTLRRGRFEEDTKTAFWAAFATAAGAYGGWNDLMRDIPLEKPLDCVEIFVFVASVVICVYSGIGNNKSQTAEEYLNELYGIAPSGRKRRFSWWQF